MPSDTTTRENVRVANFDEKIQSLMEAGNLSVSTSRAQVVKIKRVPKLLRDSFSNYQKCFEPRVLFLGPYHEAKTIPKEAKDLKEVAASLFLREADVGHFAKIYAAIYDRIDYFMQHYELEDQEDINDHKEHNVSMLFQDGCAALYFIIRSADHGPSCSMIFKTHEILFAETDLFLLENQLPYEVLEMLISHKQEGSAIIESFVRSRLRTPSTSSVRALEILSSLGTKRNADNNPRRSNLWNRVVAPLFSVPAYLQSHLPRGNNQHNRSSSQFLGERSITTEASEKPSQHVHLLQHLRTRLVGTKSSTTTKEEAAQHYISNSWRSAEDLADKGIFFKPSRSNCLLDVHFTQELAGGCLHLPSLIVDDSTRTKLLNLVADEMSSDVHNNSSVVSYLELLASLIDHPKDVKILREANIIHNFLSSDEEVTEVFNGIAKDLVSNSLLYSGIKRRIQAHVDNKRNTWMAELSRDYFGNPWTIIAFIGAIFLTFLTMAQTYFTMFPLPDGYRSSESRGLLYGLEHIYLLLAFVVPLVVIFLVGLAVYGLIRLFSSRFFRRV